MVRSNWTHQLTKLVLTWNWSRLAGRFGSRIVTKFAFSERCRRIANAVNAWLARDSIYKPGIFGAAVPVLR